MSGRDIIVVGASAGGVQALQELARALPPDLPAAVFVVVHTSPSSPGILPQIIDRAGPLPARHAEHDAPIEHGRIYVAPPDQHLLLKRDRMVLANGPRENGFRPAADPLFRTAARVFGRRVVGVVLSGGLDDGTEGVALVKQFGGVGVAQDPDEATFPGMPSSAIANVELDYVLPAGRIGKLLARLANEPPPEGAPAMSREHTDEPGRPDLAEVGDASLLTGDIPGPPSGFTCPECGGALWEMRSGKLLKFRCHVGHSYTNEALISEQARSLESALWAALRSLEENAGLRRRLARRARDSNWLAIAQQYDKQSEEAEARASVIRKVLMADEVRDTKFEADPRPPRPAYDGPLYGPKGRQGAPDEKAGFYGKDTGNGKGIGNGKNHGNGNSRSGAKVRAKPGSKPAAAAKPRGVGRSHPAGKGKGRRSGSVV